MQPRSRESRVTVPSAEEAPCCGTYGRAIAQAIDWEQQGEIPARRPTRKRSLDLKNAARSAGDARDPAVQGLAHWPFYQCAPAGRIRRGRMRRSHPGALPALRSLNL